MCGSPEGTCRAYVLSQSGVMESYSEQADWTHWWQLQYSNSPGNTRPSVPGGAAATIGQGSRLVRVYYVAEGSLYEVGLFHGQGDWFAVGAID